MNEGSILSVDIGGSAIKYGIWDNEHLTQLGETATPPSWQAMKEKLRMILDNYGKSLAGAAFSVPGAVDEEKGIIYGFSAIPYIHNFEIKKELSELLGIPVSIQNDANCAALAEVWRGNASDVQDAIFFIVGSGVGGAIVIDQRLRKSSHLFSGEFGFQVINNETYQTLSYGCSPVTMATNYSEEKNDGIVYSGKAVFDLAQSGDVLAKNYVEKFYDNLALGIFNGAVFIDPDKVLIGGGISAIEGIEETLGKRVEQLLQETGAGDLTVDISKCKYKNSANLIGAVYQFMIENSCEKDGIKRLC